MVGAAGARVGGWRGRDADGIEVGEETNNAEQRWGRREREREREREQERERERGAKRRSPRAVC